MLTIRIELVQVDYEKLAERFIPEAFSNNSDKDNLIKRVAGKILIKEGEISSFGKGLLRLIPQHTKAALAYNIILDNQERIKKAMNSFLEKELPEIQLHSLRVVESDKAVYDMLKLELVLKDIDYNSVAEQLLRMLLANKSGQEDKAGKLAKVLLGMGAAPNNMINAALDILTQEEKNELLVQFISIFSEDIADGLNHIAKQQNIAAEVEKVSICRE